MIKGLILVGGRSSRMGQPKHLLERDGKTSIQFISELLITCGLEPFVSCNSSQADELKSDHRIIVDEYDSIGPLGGIASAFKQDPKNSWLVVACDLLQIHEQAIQDLLSENKGAHDVITYKKQGSSFCETTLTLYKPSALAKINEAVGAKEYSLQRLLTRCSVKTIEVSDVGFLKNVNHRSDYFES